MSKGFIVEVGAVRVEGKGFTLSEKSLKKLMKHAASLTLALMSDEKPETQPFGFAPVSADVQVADPHHDARFDWVWDEEEE
jgi:hypothetical protein